MDPQLCLRIILLKDKQTHQQTGVKTLLIGRDRKHSSLAANWVGFYANDSDVVEDLRSEDKDKDKDL